GRRRGARPQVPDPARTSHPVVPPPQGVRHDPHRADAALMDLAAELAQHRQFLIGVAYRMLGSVQEAEDVVQDAFLRAERAAPAAAAGARAWLARVAPGLALDELRSPRGQREQSVGPWPPEPVLAPGPDSDLAAPADRVTLDEQLSLALLTVLETLSPAERAV